MRTRPACLVHDALLPTSVTAMVVLVALTLGQLASALARANHVHRRVEQLVVATAAEEAAFAAAGVDTSCAATGMATATGLPCTVVPTNSGRTLRITVTAAGGRRHRFACALLEGAAPEALARPLVVGLRSPSSAARWRLDPLPHAWVHPVERGGDDDSGPEPAPTLTPPTLTPPTSTATTPGPAPLATEALAPPSAPTLGSGLHADDQVALLRLEAGTDLPDYVFRVDAEGVVRPQIPASGVLCLDGHLWIDGSREITVLLDRSLTIVACGNVYACGSLRVLGQGRLTLVARSWRGDTFRDVDGNGRWSEGDELLHSAAVSGGALEGSGSVFLRPGGTGGRIRLGCSIVAGGDVHVAAPGAIVDGAVVAGECVTRLVPGALLECTGERLPDVEREAVPGFVRSGAPRPGRLAPLATPSR